MYIYEYMVTKEIILDILNDKDNFVNIVIQSLIPKIKEKETEKNSVSGLVLEIDKNDESYSKLIEKSKKEKWNYKGLTIVDGYDKLKVYFY